MTHKQYEAVSLRLLVRSARPYLWPAIAVNSTLMSAVCGLTATDCIVLAISLILCASSGFLFNDVLDHEIDQANGRRRLQAISRHGRVAVVACAIAGWVLAVMIPALFTSSGHWAVILIVALGSAFYSTPIRAIPVLSTLCASLLCSSPLWVPILATHDSTPLACGLLVAVALCLFVGRETILDTRDMEGDRQHGRRTFSTVWGRAKAIRFSQTSIAVGCVLMGPMPFLLDSLVPRVLAITGGTCLLVFFLIPAVLISASTNDGADAFVRLSARAFLVGAPLLCLALLVN